jgi:hypothetical protein
VPDGNIPADYVRISLKLTFNDGGHSDWAIKYEEINRNLHHAAQTARETGNTRVLQTVHDEQLPEYTAGPGPSQAATSPVQVDQRAQDVAAQREERMPLPDEPPPDYDEAQAQAVAMQFDERTREDAERQ